jgi:hypothetical protein
MDGAELCHHDTFVTTRVLTAILAVGAGSEAVSVPAQWSLLVLMMVLVELGLALAQALCQQAGTCQSRAHGRHQLERREVPCDLLQHFRIDDACVAFVRGVF